MRQSVKEFVISLPKWKAGTVYKIQYRTNTRLPIIIIISKLVAKKVYLKFNGSFMQIVKPDSERWRPLNVVRLILKFTTAFLVQHFISL